MPPTLPPITGAPFHIASVTVMPKPSRVDFCRTTAALRCSAFTSSGSSALVIPHRWVGNGHVDVALPQPGHLAFREVLAQSQGLGIVDDDGVAIVEMQPEGVLEHDLLVQRLIGVGELDPSALQAIVQL